MSVQFESLARIAVLLAGAYARSGPVLVVATLANVIAGCAPVDGEPIVVSMPDDQEFAEKVYPVLLKDCGFPACHGDPRRFFRVYGPGRTRLLPETLPYDPATEQEIQHSYDRARSMVAAAPDEYESLLLRKPLPRYSGGSEHKGTDSLGRNVFSSSDDADYQVLQHWVLSAQGNGEETP